MMTICRIIRKTHASPLEHLSDLPNVRELWPSVAGRVDMGGGQGGDEPCILGGALFEDNAQRGGSGAAGRESEETAVCALEE